MPFPYDSENRPNSTQAILAGVASVSAGAGVFRVSSITAGASLTFDGDAANNRVSAIQQDANNLRVCALGSFALSGDAAGNRVSAIQGDATNLNVSAKSDDAGKMRVSAFGTFSSTPVNDTIATATISAIGNSHVIVTSAGQSMVGLQLSGTWTGQVDFAVTVDDFNWIPHDFINSQTDQIVNAATSNGLFFAGVGGFKKVRVSATTAMTGSMTLTSEAATAIQSFHLESPLPEGTNFIGHVSAKSADAGQILVSAKQGDAALLRISALNQDANFMHVSAVGTMLVSSHEVKQSDAASLLASAKSGDANQFHVSAVQGDAALQRTSAIQGDAALQRVSAIQDGAAALNVSAKSDGANLFRVSAILEPDVRPKLSMFSTSAGIAQLSSLKSTSANIYAYQLFNPAGVDQYLQMFSVSAITSIALGTAVPDKVVGVPAGGGANLAWAVPVSFGSGVSIAVTSTAGGNTAGASAMRVNIDYK